jgi:GT2 family glycosyltransferase
MSYTLRQKFGVIVYDWVRYEKGLRCSAGTDRYHYPWLEICNRNESLERAPHGPGVLCKWKWTSDLHAAKVFPSLGLRLMKRAFQDWPVVLQNKLSQRDDTHISFVIGHRGTTRLPHLLTTLQTIAAQRDVSLECIVVEQSSTPEIRDALPIWVRYIHTAPRPNIPYCRSWAFNVGARMAKGDLLVFHDNDMLMPRDYAAQLLARFRGGYEVINLKRLIFYLNENHSRQIMASGTLLQDHAPQTVVQNLEAGGSLAVGKDAFFAIGGFDESFIGWGGEDNEFWERAQTRKVWPYGYLPIIHLWHAPQPGKRDGQYYTAQHYRALSKVAPSERIRRLVGRPMGLAVGPTDRSDR